MLWYLVPSIVMFTAGVFGFVTRKNMIALLISLELILNSADLNFVIFNRYLFPGSMEGMVFTLFAIAIAAAEDIGGDSDNHQYLPCGRQHEYRFSKKNAPLIFANRGKKNSLVWAIHFLY